MGCQPLADHHFLLVAARESFDRLFPAKGFYLQPLRIFVCQLPLAIVIQHAVGVEFVELWQADVLRNRQFDNRPLLLALFRHADDPGFDGIRWLAEMLFFTVQHNAAGRRARDAGERLHQLGTPGAHQPVEAEDLAFAQGKSDVRELGRVAEILHLQHDIAFFAFHLREGLGNGAPHHHRHHPLFGDVIDGPCADKDAVAQNGVVIGQFKNLVEFMRDKQDRFPFLL